MNTDTGRIYSPEEMKAFNESLEGIPVQSDFKLSDYIAKNPLNPTELNKEMLQAKKDGTLMEMEVSPTNEQMQRNPPKVGRNEMCPCGSGKKFKKCHWTGHKI